MTRSTITTTLLVAALAFMPVAGAGMQDDPPQTNEPEKVEEADPTQQTEATEDAASDDATTPPVKDDAARDDGAQPTLDELLNIAEESEGGEEEGVDGLPDVREELEDKTEEEQGISGLFLSAVSSMDDSATRLNNLQDPGLVTQRLQEDAIRKLDELIKAAEQQQQQQQGQPQPQSQDGQQPPQSPEDSQQSQQTQTPGQSNADNQGTDTRPGMRDGDLDRNIDETRAEWGNLPQRVRDMLMQGRGDTSASLYRRLTERYYERLAEEASENNPR